MDGNKFENSLSSASILKYEISSKFPCRSRNFDCRNRSFDCRSRRRNDRSLHSSTCKVYSKLVPDKFWKGKRGGIGEDAAQPDLVNSILNALLAPRYDEMSDQLMISTTCT